MHVRSSVAVPVEPDPGPVVCRKAGDRLTWAFPSHPACLAEVRRAVEAFCRSTSLDDPACDEMGLVVNEALANVIRHAYAGATDRPVEVTAERQGDGVRLSIRDWGNGRVPKPTDNPAAADPLMPGGLGLICLRRLTDDATFEPQPDGGMKLVIVRTTPGLRSTTCDNPL
jgi:serine/threonine-protein kinase RsbW